MSMYSVVVIGWDRVPPLGIWSCHVEKTCLDFQHRPPDAAGRAGLQ